MATVSTPVSAWVATLVAGTSVSANGNITVSMNITGAWEIQFPIRIAFSRTSADPAVQIYRSMDGGVTYDSTPMAGFSIARVAQGVAQASMQLSTGQYLLRVDALVSGGDAISVALLTQLIITAIQNT